MRILLVEDQARHREEAIAVLGKIEGVELVVVENYSLARRALLEQKYYGQIDAVITDLFLPQGLSEMSEGEVEQLGADSADQPRGLGIKLIADAKKVPAVVCTSGYHHGTNYQWVHDLLGRQGLIDCGWDPDTKGGESANQKNWIEAYENIKDRVQRMAKQ